ncbi:Hypothetical predicted protein [Cloeon dipterum]|uniref:Chitin-binding type-2 domain-containing protein n=1 Tax=Cloeon dipterum TaxID=197152 RepID=A0A8S1C6P4_9INSE|nr:Hypothetical predicted protein [Cloeon dipterum]
MKSLTVLCLLLTASSHAFGQSLDLKGLKNYKCNKTGIQAHPTDCQAYLYCDQSFGVKYNIPYVALKCPTGQAFSAKEEICIAQNKLKPCLTQQGPNKVPVIKSQAISKHRTWKCPAKGTYCVDKLTVALCVSSKTAPNYMALCGSLSPQFSGCQDSQTTKQGSCRTSTLEAFAGAGGTTSTTHQLSDHQHIYNICANNASTARQLPLLALPPAHQLARRTALPSTSTINEHFHQHIYNIYANNKHLHKHVNHHQHANYLY